MDDLAKLAIEAHGGSERWSQFESVSAHLLVGGVLWQLKGKGGILDHVHVTAALRRVWASHHPFKVRNQHTVFQPDRIAVETKGGGVVNERFNPRDSFNGHTLETPWDDMQLAYFAGYAMWTYLNTPFLFELPDVQSEEIEPWQENGESWRRLRTTFPPSIPSHSTIQTFYFDQAGVLRRHDYNADVLGGTRAAHYVSDHKEFSGILVPTKRRVFMRGEDGHFESEPLVVSIDLREVEFK